MTSPNPSDNLNLSQYINRYTVNLVALKFHGRSSNEGEIMFKHTPSGSEKENKP